MDNLLNEIHYHLCKCDKRPYLINGTQIVCKIGACKYGVDIRNLSEDISIHTCKERSGTYMDNHINEHIKDPPQLSEPTVPKQSSELSALKRQRVEKTPPPNEVNERDIANRESVQSVQSQVPPSLLFPQLEPTEPTEPIVSESLETSFQQASVPFVKLATDDLLSNFMKKLNRKLEELSSNIGQNDTLQDVKLNVTFNIEATSLDNY